jgi:diaminohydroxyphosphoribosylaminopyrimidine deaminase / 5-amino-6-(5-phosphoribosylamino)uracil reductase
VSELGAPDWAELWAHLRVLAAYRPAVSAAPSDGLEPNARGANGVLSVRCRAGGAAEVVEGEHPEASLVSRGGGRVSARRTPAEAARKFFELYAPLCHPYAPSARRRPDAPRSGCFVVAHLGQSLDGRIGPASGTPEAITGPEDMTHNHRMRALFDVVLVGAGTVCHDDPTLTVRHVEGRNPVRVVVDPDRRLAAHYGVFADDLAPTLLLCRQELCRDGERHGQAEVVGVGAGCTPRAVLDVLHRRGLPRVFIEGGGVTVSRFLSAGCLSRLQLAVSPMIMGQGKPGIDLGETLRLRPLVRRFELSEDVLFECCFDEER